MPPIFVVGGGTAAAPGSTTPVSALDFITRALRLLNMIDPTEAPSAEDAEDAFQTLNDWIDSLGTQRLTIYALQRATKTLTSGTASYTIGDGGDIDVIRPVWIEQGSAGLILDIAAATPLEYPLTVLTDDQYKGVAQKTFQNGQVEAIYYDHNWSAALGRIYPFPIPNVSTTQLVLYLPTALTEFANLSTEYTFPPAYRRAIRYNLAMELANDFHVDPPAAVARIASDTMAWIKRANYRPSVVRIDPALTGKRGGVTRSQFEGGDF